MTSILSGQSYLTDSARVFGSYKKKFEGKSTFNYDCVDVDTVLDHLHKSIAAKMQFTKSTSSSKLKEMPLPIYIQSNFNGSNTFGTMKISSRRGSSSQ